MRDTIRIEATISAALAEAHRAELLRQAQGQYRSAPGAARRGVAPLLSARLLSLRHRRAHRKPAHIRSDPVPRDNGVPDVQQPLQGVRDHDEDIGYAPVLQLDQRGRSRGAHPRVGAGPAPREADASNVTPWRGRTIDVDDGSPAITVRGLRKAYPSTVAVDDVSFDIGHGEIFGILGPNGAGKTTTVEILTGLRRPELGSVDVLGLDPWRDRAAFTEAVGVQLQSSRLPEKIRVGEAVELYRSFYRDPVDGRELLDRLGLSGSLRIRYAALSGGQQQRLAVALALIGRPRVAVLDELTTGLDPQARRETWDLITGIRDRGATVVLVTHFMEEAEYLCDRLVLINHGRVIAEGSPAQVAQGTAGTNRVTFRPSAPFADTLLTDLTAVTGLTRSEDRVSVRGDANMLQAVASTLSNAGIVTQDLRVHQDSLEDAFVALLGQPDPTTIAADAAR